jgi:hypothetical protein
MRRFAVIVIVMLLGLAPLIGIGTARATEEVNGFTLGNTPFEPWEGVSQPRAVKQEPLRGGKVAEAPSLVQPYEVYFGESFAAVPVVEQAEFMLVVVEDGVFALDLRNVEGLSHGPGLFIVDPSGGAKIAYMDYTGIESEGFYVPNGAYVQDASGDCVSMCVISAESFVQVKSGDKIIAPRAGICVWCLLSEKGLLLVAPVLENSADAPPFSWLAGWMAHQGDKGNSNRSATPTIMGWAFNPPPGCHRGPS